MAVAWSLRVAVKGEETDKGILCEDDIAEDDLDKLDRERDAEAEVTRAEEVAMRGDAARRAGRDWARDRRAAMMRGRGNI